MVDVAVAVVQVVLASIDIVGEERRRKLPLLPSPQQLIGRREDCTPDACAGSLTAALAVLLHRIEATTSSYSSTHPSPIHPVQNPFCLLAAATCINHL